MSKNECNEWEVQGQIKWGNYWKLFLFVVGSCEHFQNSRDHKSMNANSAIEELQWITKEKEPQKEWAKTKAGGGSEIIKGKKKWNCKEQSMKEC
jgi:hypothetical protein